MPLPVTSPSPLVRAAWSPDVGYWQLAQSSVLPAFKRLAAGKRDADALLCAAFSPLVHLVLELALERGMAGLPSFLRGLTRPPRPESATHWVTPGAAWKWLQTLPAGEVAAVFDLRPGGGPELDTWPYAPLLDQQGRIPEFHQELLPLVLSVLQGWGASVLLIPPAHTPLPVAQAQWAALCQAASPAGKRAG